MKGLTKGAMKEVTQDQASGERLSALLFGGVISLSALCLTLLLASCAPHHKTPTSTLNLEEPTEALHDELEDVVKGASALGAAQASHERETSAWQAKQRAAAKAALKRAKLATLKGAREARFTELESADVGSYQQALARGERAVAITLKSAQGELRCALAPSPLAAAVLETLSATSAPGLEVRRSQPGLWLELELSQEAQARLSASLSTPLSVATPSGASRPSQRAESASATAPLLSAPPALPLESRGGDWVAISRQEVLEALILEGPTPWLPPSAHLIGRCEPEGTLEALTRAEVGQDLHPSPSAALSLTHLGWMDIAVKPTR